jgi:hypothetical protein
MGWGLGRLIPLSPPRMQKRPERGFFFVFLKYWLEVRPSSSSRPPIGSATP